MADRLSVDRAHPLAAHLQSGALSAGAAVHMRALPAVTRFVLRGDTAAAAAAGAAVGVSLPIEPMRAAAAGTRAALWLGPDEWLLLAGEAEADALRISLATALAGLASSLVDVSHRQTTIEVSGTRVENVLNALVPLDLSLPAFPAGMCTRTLLAKAEVVLLRRSPEAFHLDVARSLAPYAWGMLREAMLEYEMA